MLYVCLLFVKVLAVARVDVPVVVGYEPPHGVARQPAHPLVGFEQLFRQVEALVYHVVVSEHGCHGVYLGVYVARPHKAVAFNTVPKVLLHVQVHGVCSGHPDVVKALVAAFERTEVRDVAVFERGAHFLEQYVGIVAEHVNPHEAEARVAAFGYSQPGQLDGEVAHGVVVGGTVLVVDVAHGLFGRFAETHSYFCGLRGRHAGYNLYSAVNLAPEVEEQRVSAVAGVVYVAKLHACQCGLAVIVFKQHVLVLDFCVPSGLCPHNPFRQDIRHYARVGFQRLVAPGRHNIYRRFYRYAVHRLCFFLGCHGDGQRRACGKA